MKGLVLIQLNNPTLCPVQLVRGLFDRVRSERLAYTKHVVRIIPLQYIGFPNATDLAALMSAMINNVFANYVPTTAAIVPSPEEAQPAGTDPEEPVCKRQRTQGEEEEEEGQPTSNSRSSNSTSSYTSSSKAPAHQALPAGRVLPIQYSILFKSRNSSSLVKSEVHDCVFRLMPGPGSSIVKSNYKTPEVGGWVCEGGWV